MAATFEAAFAAVEGPELDLICGYVVPPRRRAPADEASEAACRKLDYRHLIDRLAAFRRCDRTLAEEAVHDILEAWLVRRPGIFRKDPESWMGLLFSESDYRLRKLRDPRMRTESIEALREAAGDAPLVGARRCVPLAPFSDDGYRCVPPPEAGEEWSRAQVLGAIQRFRDYYGHPPKSADFKPVNRLPSLAVVYRIFDDLSAAILAAGMVPDGPGRRRKAWKPVESAKACLSFRWRNSHWPGLSESRRNPGELPTREAMMKYFGGTRPAQVQEGAELILAAKGISA